MSRRSASWARGLFATVAFVCSFTAAANSRADGAPAPAPEPVTLTYAAPVECEDEADFKAQVEAVGGALRPPNGTEPARSFAVAIDGSSGRFAGTLVVRNRVGESTTRAVAGDACAEVVRSLALFVVLALDLPPPSAVERAPDSPTLWPAPAETRRERPPSRAAGLALGAFWGIGAAGATEQKGLRGIGAVTVGVTRVGAAVSISNEVTTVRDTGHSIVDARGQSLRVGGIVGWGAPWTNGVVGFVGELGVAAGHESGRAWTRYGKWGDSVGGNDCVYTNASVACGPVSRTSSFVSPYGAVSLMVQIPWRFKVRPFVGTTMLLVPGYHDGSLFMASGEAGLAWHSW